MKRVALVSDGWKRMVTYAWNEGITKRIDSSDEDICLYHYHCFGNWSRDSRFNQGEYNIFNLPDFSNFDGIILDCNNIIEPQRKEWLVEKLRSAQVPVVSIGQVIDGFYYVGIDNREPIISLMNHLYYEHGCRSFVWAGGPRGNYENERRLDAFRGSLGIFNLREEEGTVLYGDFDFDTGKGYIRDFVEKGKAFPDVFVCANDNIAAGICAEAERFGYSVPEAFKVTGFDNLDKAIYYKPQITTVNQSRVEIASQAMDILMKLWKGTSIAPFTFVPTKCIFGESCGCQNNGLVNYRDYIKKRMLWELQTEDFRTQLGEFEDIMADAESFTELFDAMAGYFMKLDCDGFYLIVDDRLMEADRRTAFCVTDYDKDRLRVVCAVERDGDVKVKSIKELIAHNDSNGAGQTYTMTPIHFREQTVGVIVVKNPRFLYTNSYYYEVTTACSANLESFFKRQQLANAIEKIQDVYNRDQLTGLYNRVAYQEMILPLFKKCNSNGINCALAFFDVDNFKTINDTRGHKYGDEILKGIANIIKKHMPMDGYAYRFGGDEFVAFVADTDEERMKNFCSRVEKEMAKKSVKASVGVIITDPKSEKTLDDYLLMADQKMYDLKRIVHSSDKL